MKNLAMLPSYFGYIFVHQTQKARFRPELSPKFFVNFRPEPDLESPARLTTLSSTINSPILKALTRFWKIRKKF